MTMPLWLFTLIAAPVCHLARIAVYKACDMLDRHFERLEARND